MKKIVIIFICFLFETMICFSAEKIYLKDVIFLREPVDRLIFEFSNKPKFEINKNKNKIKFSFYNTIPESSTWMKILPKEIFKEINASYEENKLYLEFILNKDFNFQVSSTESKLILNFIWKKPKKPLGAVIKKEKVQYFEKKTHPKLLLVQIF